MYPIKKDALSILSSIALYGGIGLAVTNVIFQWNFQWRVRKTKTYKTAMQMVHDHKKTLEHLGEPIKVGRVYFDFDDEIRRFNILLKGKKNKGKLNCEYIVTPDNNTKIKKVEIKFGDLLDKVFVLHEA